MCGRVRLDMDWSEMVELYRLPQAEPPLELPLLDVRPTDPLVAIVADGGRRAVRARWGFPSLWLRDRDPWKAPLFNAKSEEAPDKPVWSRAFREGRCLVPTTGFVEWLKEGKARFPLLFSDGPALTLAGL